MRTFSFNQIISLTKKICQYITELKFLERIKLDPRGVIDILKSSANFALDSIIFVTKFNAIHCDILIHAHCTRVADICPRIVPVISKKCLELQHSSMG